MIEGFVGWVKVPAKHASFIGTIRWSGAEHKLVRGIEDDADGEKKIQIQRVENAHLPHENRVGPTIDLPEEAIIEVVWYPGVEKIAVQ